MSLYTHRVEVDENFDWNEEIKWLTDKIKLIKTKIENNF